MLREKLDFDDRVRVVFENNDEEQIIVVRGHPIAVKSAIMVILARVAKEEEVTLIELLKELMGVAKIKEEFDKMDEIMNPLRITKG